VIDRYSRPEMTAIWSEERVADPRLRALVGLTRATAVVGAVGSGYEDAAGIRPGLIAR